MARGFHAVAMATLGAALTVNVFVRDGVELPPELLADAKAAASRCFRRAGVEIVWLEGAEIGGRRDFYTVRVEAEGSGVLGSAAIGTRVATVFHRRIAQVTRAADGDLSMVLGHAMAHEIGHLLLGTTAHSASGIMRAQLDVPLAAQGRLLFSEDDARAIRARLSR